MTEWKNDLLNIGRRIFHLGNFGPERVGGSVDDVDAIAAQAGDDKPVPAPAGIVVAAGAGVPAGVMDLITQVWEFQTVNDLRT